jgi:hypothetical protein
MRYGAGCLRDGRAAACLAALGAGLLATPAAAADSELTDRQADAMRLCVERFTSEYGATSIDNLNLLDDRKHLFVYGDVRRADGQVLRMRCNYRKNAVQGIEVYSEGDRLKPNSPEGWGPADAYKVEAQPPQEPPAEAPTGEAPMEPAKPHWVKPDD